jgi:hypothetical protein
MDVEEIRPLVSRAVKGHILMNLSSAGQDELTGYWYAVRP